MPNGPERAVELHATIRVREGWRAVQKSTQIPPVFRCPALRHKIAAMRISRRQVLRTVGSGVAALPFLRLRGQQLANPNIVFIITDDQRQDSMSAYGNTVLKT